MIPSTLTNELIQRLAWLSGQPPGLAEVAISAMPYGSRVALIAHELILPVATGGDEPVEITITDKGWSREAAAELEWRRSKEFEHQARASSAVGRAPSARQRRWPETSATHLGPELGRSWPAFRSSLKA